MAKPNPKWVAKQMDLINTMDVSDAVRVTLRDAVLDAKNALDLVKRYRRTGCPLCGSRDLEEHQHMVLCKGCGRRVA